MFCPKCGKELKDDALFCSGCGNALNSEAGAAENSAGGAVAKKKLSPKGLIILISMVIVFFVILIVFFSVMRAMRSGGEPPDDVSLPFGDKPFTGFEGGLNVGDKVVFGRYEQDCNTGNGAEPLEWDVIGKSGGKYMLTTHYVIDYKQYDNGTSDIGVNAGGSAKDAIVTWEKCSLRKWLNSEFMETAFTDEEKSYVQSVINQNPNWLEFDDGTLGALDIKEGGYGGNMTEDKVFLLDVPELFVYFQPAVYVRGYNRMFFPNAIVSGTPYAESLAESGACFSLEDLFGDEEARAHSSLWKDDGFETYIDMDYQKKEALMACFTRSPGCWRDSSGAFVIKADGGAGAAFSKTEYCGIRPVVWVTAN